jgi:HEAT repeat protein
VPALIKSVEQRGPVGDGQIDINGIWALGRIGPDAKSAIPLLESIVKNNSGRQRVYAAEALMKVGGDSFTAIAAFEKTLEDGDRQARTEAAEALRKARLTLPVGAKESDPR